MMNSKDMRDALRERAGRTRISPRRPVKLQICLTPAERVQLSEHARAAGFDSMSSYVRARTLEGKAR